MAPFWDQLGAKGRPKIALLGTGGEKNDEKWYKSHLKRNTKIDAEKGSKKDEKSSKNGVKIY